MGKSEIKVEILERPEEKDWQRCKMLALATQGKESRKPVEEEWKIKMLRAEHSPIRTLRFLIRMEIPYFCSVHLCRHKIGVEHYVRSQRKESDGLTPARGAERQDVPVIHTMEINAQALMQMARARLCNRADQTTQAAMQEIVKQIISLNPEFKGFLEPKCRYLQRCDEIKSCGLTHTID